MTFAVRCCRTAARVAALGFGLLAAATAHGDEDSVPTPMAARPTFKSNRWQEDWSALSDPALRTEPFDPLRYIPLRDGSPATFLTLGATLRERYENNDAPAFGAAGTSRDAYLLERLQLHANLHFNENLRLFVQVEDDRAFKKQVISAADQDRVDLRLAFLEYDTPLAGGTLKTRVGRQDFAFDLQRFVSSRDGPNVRQSFDAVWADWETGTWRFIGFVSHPVQYHDDHSFDDRSSSKFRFSTLRVERHVLGDNELSAYYSLYQRSNAKYGSIIGDERRNIFDGRFAGSSGQVDWDVEGMLQTGSVGAASVHAWAGGPRVGYTLSGMAWKPRFGLQVDAASGDRQASDNRVGTFNPLFPNGNYFSLAGYTGYANLVQVKPSVTVKPMTRLTVLTGVGFLWRQTAADSIYVQPNVPVAGTAGHGDRWTGRYAQVRTDYIVNANLALSLEAVHYQIGEALRSAGGHDSSYVGIEMKSQW